MLIQNSARNCKKWKKSREFYGRNMNKNILLDYLQKYTKMFLIVPLFLSFKIFFRSRDKVDVKSGGI